MNLILTLNLALSFVAIDRAPRVLDRPIWVVDQPVPVVDRLTRCADQLVRVVDRPARVTERPTRVADPPTRSWTGRLGSWTGRRGSWTLRTGQGPVDPGRRPADPGHGSADPGRGPGGASIGPFDPVKDRSIQVVDRVARVVVEQDTAGRRDGEETSSAFASQSSGSLWRTVLVGDLCRSVLSTSRSFISRRWTRTTRFLARIVLYIDVDAQCDKLAVDRRSSL